ncbi:hypothetical protein PR048_024742 [Dryococelus australis]|uniref:Uncharacterized protein n=1 Tax=Dryococelus australis TaxID=614101 RepID=A0ABQ9GPH5_9NEOP|nr:hypothetical protein PR048_024742 [Dryococelus australis]
MCWRGVSVQRECRHRIVFSAITVFVFIFVNAAFMITNPCRSLYVVSLYRLAQTTWDQCRNSSPRENDSSYRPFFHANKHFVHRWKLDQRIGTGDNQLAMMQVKATIRLARSSRNSYTPAKLGAGSLGARPCDVCTVQYHVCYLRQQLTGHPLLNRCTFIHYRPKSNWALVHNVCSVVVTPLESRRATSCGYNSSHPVWYALYECLQDIHGDSSLFLLQPFYELSYGFWPRLTSPPAILFVPKMFYRVEVGALGGPVKSANIVVGLEVTAVSRNPVLSRAPGDRILSAACIAGRAKYNARLPTREYCTGCQPIPAAVVTAGAETMRLTYVTGTCVAPRSKLPKSNMAVDRSQLQSMISTPALDPQLLVPKSPYLLYCNSCICIHAECKLNFHQILEDVQEEVDELRVKSYLKMCRILDTPPISNVINSLEEETLNLKHRRIDALAMRALVEILSPNTTIRNMDLSHVILGPRAAYFLGEILLTNNNIEDLNLSWCRCEKSLTFVQPYSLSKHHSSLLVMKLPGGYLSAAPPPFPVSPPPPEQTSDQDSPESARTTRRRRVRTQLTPFSRSAMAPNGRMAPPTNQKAPISLLVSHQGDPRSMPGRVTPDFSMWELCRTMTLDGGFYRGSPVSLALSFRRCSIITSITLIGSQNLDVKSRPNLFTHQHIIDEATQQGPLTLMVLLLFLAICRGEAGFIDYIQEALTKTAGLRNIPGTRNIEGTAVVELLACSHPTKANRVQFPARATPGFSLVGGFFLGDIPFPPPLYSGAAPFSPHFTHMGFQYLSMHGRSGGKHRLTLEGEKQSSRSKTVVRGFGRHHRVLTQDAGLTAVQVSRGASEVLLSRLVLLVKRSVNLRSQGQETRERYGRHGHAHLAPHGSYAQGVKCFRRGPVLCKSDILGETGEPRENPSTSGIVLQDSHTCEKNPGAIALGIGPDSPRLGPEGIEQLKTGLMESSVRTLDLSHNSLGDDGMEHLAEVLSQESSIRSLILRRNEVVDHTVVAGAEVDGAVGDAVVSAEELDDTSSGTVPKIPEDPVNSGRHIDASAEEVYDMTEEEEVNGTAGTTHEEVDDVSQGHVHRAKVKVMGQGQGYAEPIWRLGDVTTCQSVGASAGARRMSADDTPPSLDVFLMQCLNDKKTSFAVFTGVILALVESGPAFDSEGSLGEKSTKLLAESLQIDSRMENIDLSGNDLSSGEGKRALLEAFAAHPGLTTLDLSWTGLGGEMEGRALGDLLANNAVLTSLDISNNLTVFLSITASQLNGACLKNCRPIRTVKDKNKLDHIKNNFIRGAVKVTELTKKVQERRLLWYGHIKRRNDNYVGKKVLDLEVVGRTNRGKPRRRWMDCVREDLREKQLNVNDIWNRAKWKRLSRNTRPARIRANIRLARKHLANPITAKCGATVNEPTAEAPEPCRMMPLVGGFSRGFPFRPRPFIPALLHTHLTSPRVGSQDLDVKSHPNLFTHSLVSLWMDRKMSSKAHTAVPCHSDKIVRLMCNHNQKSQVRLMRSGISPILSHVKTQRGGRPLVVQSVGAPPIWGAGGSGLESRSRHGRYLELASEEIRMMCEGLATNVTLETLNIGHNRSTPDDCKLLLRAASASAVQILDMGNAWVDKEFLQVSETMECTRRVPLLLEITEITCVSSAVTEQHISDQYVNISHVPNNATSIHNATLRRFIELDSSCAEILQLLRSFYNTLDIRRLRQRFWSALHSRFMQNEVLEKRQVMVKFGGVSGNYIIHGPDIKKLHLASAKYEAQAPKKARQRRDFGRNGIRFPTGSLRDFRVWEKIGPDDVTGGRISSEISPPPPQSGAAPYSTRFTLIDSRDPKIKRRPNLSTPLH